jgi:hypothetical protein
MTDELTTDERFSIRTVYENGTVNYHHLGGISLKEAIAAWENTPKAPFSQTVLIDQRGGVWWQ